MTIVVVIMISRVGGGGWGGPQAWRGFEKKGQEADYGGAPKESMYPLVGYLRFQKPEFQSRFWGSMWLVSTWTLLTCAS